MTKVAVVTGTSRGLGLVIAKEFLARGYVVVGIGRSERPAELPHEVDYRQFDASDSDACDNFWEQFAKDSPDASLTLVNNAGGYIGGGLAESEADDFRKMMDSCYLAGVFMTRALVRNVASARIVNVISSVGLKPAKNNTAYGAAKAAERYFFQSLQSELDQDKYRITNLYPNSIATSGPAEHSIKPAELAKFIADQADQKLSYYSPDVSLFAD